MSFPLKVAAGILGGGAVAVGGHEIFAASTGKAGLFISKAPSNSQERTGGQATVSGEVGNQANGGRVEQTTNKGKIEELLKGWEGKCTLKVKEETNEDWKKIEDETSLEKLLKALEEFSKNNCKNQTEQKRIVIFKKDENSGWTEITEETSNKFSNALLHYFQTDEDIVFTVEKKNGSNWETLDDDYLTFGSENDEVKEIKVSVSIIGEDRTAEGEETKDYKFTGSDNFFGEFKKELPKGFLNWTCIIKLEKTGTDLTQLDKKEKLMNPSSTEGLFNKLKIDTNGGTITDDKQKIKVKELKKRFIANCNKGEKAIQENETTIMQTKTFKLTKNSEANKLIFSDDQEFKTWFEEVELTQEENAWINGDKDWNISMIGEKNSAGHKIFELKGENKIAGCFIKVGETKNNFETKLKEKINTDATNKTNNRQKFLKKCRNNANTLFLHINDDVDAKVSSLLDVE